MLRLLSHDVSGLVYIEAHRYNLSAVNDEYRMRYTTKYDGMVLGSIHHWFTNKCYNYRTLNYMRSNRSIYNKYARMTTYYLPANY